MKIWNLKSENFKKLNVELALNGKSVTVTGKNESGKSSFIDSIFKTLTGEKIKGSPVQLGKSQARNKVVIRKDDGSTITVERIYADNKNTSLKVTLNGSKTVKSPQAFLDATLGEISFDPLVFVNKTPLEQKRFLMELLNINLEEFEEKKRTALDEVQSINNDLIKVSGELESLPLLEKEYKFIDSADVVKEAEKINELKKQVTKLDNEIDYKGESKFQLEEHNKKLYKQMTAILEEIDNNKKLIESITSDVDELEKEKDSIIIPESSSLETQIKEININNEYYRNQQERISKQREFESIETAKKDALGKVKLVEIERNKMLSEIKMPIDGLEFMDTGLSYNGLALTEDNISTSRIIEIGIRIAVAMNPNLRILQIKDGSLLDKDMMKTIKDICKESDYQLFIEKVSDEKELGFIIDEELSNA